MAKAKMLALVTSSNREPPTWHNLAEQGADVYSDSNWPECPTEVVEFAKAF